MADYKLSVNISDNGSVVLVTDQTIPAKKGVDMPWEIADQLARALTVMARRAEEYCKANAIIMDNALLQRCGANIGLSDHPKIKDETVKEALHNRELRRARPWRDKNVAAAIEGIRSRGVVGAPSLSKSPATATKKLN